jgi:hypothetical protein
MDEPNPIEELLLKQKDIDIATEMLADLLIICTTPNGKERCIKYLAWRVCYLRIEEMNDQAVSAAFTKAYAIELKKNF